jgi:hypothetical protein
MTTFKEISGQLIRTLSSDPANPQEGQIWYNSTIGVLKGYKISCSCLGRWWKFRNRSISFRVVLELQTAALAFGGETPSNN